MNLEYFNAFFIKDFKKKINFKTLKKVEIIWHDPFVEKRDKSIKYSEGFTSIFQDQLLHITSIVKCLD